VLATGRSQVASANRTSNQGLCYGRGVVDGAEAFLAWGLWRSYGRMLVVISTKKL